MRNLIKQYERQAFSTISILISDLCNILYNNNCNNNYDVYKVKVDC